MQSVNRALDVLFYVAALDRPVSPAEVASELAIPRPTVYRILETLTTRAIVARVSDGFITTPKLAELVLSERVLDLADIAAPYLHRLVAVAHETAGLHVRIGDLRRCISEIEGFHGIRWARGVGFMAPLWSGAVGHVLLAGLRDDELAEMISRIDFGVRLAKNTITSAGALREKVATARLNGWSSSESETIEGACAIAAPLKNNSDSTVAALSLYAPSGRFDEVRRLAPDLIAISEEASDLWSRQTRDSVAVSST